MRRAMPVLALVLVAALLGGCAAESPAPASDGLTLDRVAERVADAPGAAQLFAVNVGKGDALILRIGDYICLIDTGRVQACGRLRAALAAMGVAPSGQGGRGLDAVFITHTDNDHTGGLDWLASGAAAVPTERWYASARYIGEEEDHPAIEAAALAGGEVRWLGRGDAVALGDTGATLRVLAPASLFQDKDDNNSLVMLLECGQGRILFTGDMELPEEAELLSFGDDLACDVLKVPNHGDGDATGEALVRAAGAKLALISTDSQEKPGTPDPDVVRRLQAAGCRVAVTQDADMGILVTLSGGDVSAESVTNDAPLMQGLTLAEVDAEDDRIVLANATGQAVALDGFSLFSDKGNELFVFPEGARIEPGGTLTVGTRSTDGDYDLLWDDKKVVNKKKTDVIWLYDGFGRILDTRDNGR